MRDLWNQYRIHINQRKRKDGHVYGIQFINRENISFELQEIGRMFQAPDAKVAASLFVKRYCAYIAVLEAMSRRNMKVELPLQSISFICTETQVAIYTLAPSVEECMNANRTLWRDRVIARIFREHVGVIIDALAKETRLASSIMWSHVAFYVHVMYRKWIQEALSESERERLIEDFHYLCEAPAHLFGRDEGNPFQVSFCKVQHPAQGEEVLLRRTCCLNYKAGTKGACYTCPRLTETERIRKMQQSYMKA
ncbi:MAG: hypothetical protein ACE3JP_11895 [Ectobacillus sp.]